MISKCSYVESLRHDYFTHQLTNNQMHLVVNHLRKCSKCLASYFEYATSIGIEFDIVREVLKINLKYPKDENYTEDEPIEEPSPEDTNAVTKFIANAWTIAAKEEDYYKLMNSRAIRDCVKERSALSDNENTSEQQRAFNLYLIQKICQKIDHLELCYNLKE